MSGQQKREKNEHAVALGKLGGRRKRPVTTEEARNAANVRWAAYRLMTEAEKAPIRENARRAAHARAAQYRQRRLAEAAQALAAGSANLGKVADALNASKAEGQ